MTTSVFETYWLVDGRRYYDLREVSRLVADGAVAREFTAEQQRQQWLLQKAQERWHVEAMNRHSAYVQEQRYRTSPDGRAAAVRRQAEQSGGSVVTACQPQDAAFSELDRYSAAATNRFKL